MNIETRIKKLLKELGGKDLSNKELNVKSWKFDSGWPDHPEVDGVLTGFVGMSFIMKEVARASHIECLTSPSEWVREFRKWWDQ